MSNTLLPKERSQEIETMVNNLIKKEVKDYDQQKVVEKIAEDENIKLQQAKLQDISGMLRKEKNGSWSITVNQDDSATRKLFTVAHELGHYFLHRHNNEEFIDSQFMPGGYARKENTKYQLKEIEANEFAGNLIMPKIVIEEEICQQESKTIEITTVNTLAKKFYVSPLAMGTRLRNLGYVIK